MSVSELIWPARCSMKRVRVDHARATFAQRLLLGLAEDRRDQEQHLDVVGVAADRGGAGARTSSRIVLHALDAVGRRR